MINKELDSTIYPQCLPLHSESLKTTEVSCQLVYLQKSILKMDSAAYAADLKTQLVGYHSTAIPYLK